MVVGLRCFQGPPNKLLEIEGTALTTTKPQTYQRFKAAERIKPASISIWPSNPTELWLMTADFSQ